MARYFAELNADKTVKRVIVCDDPDWPAENLGGTWVETSDPYKARQTVRYCGPGDGYDETHPQRFAPVYDPAAREALTTEQRTATKDELVYSDGRIRRVEDAETRTR